MLQAGFTLSEYNRALRALRGLGGWPARVTIRPAHVTDIAQAKRTVVWEVEAVFTCANDVGIVEQLVLSNGGWLRQVEVEEIRSQHSRSRAFTYRALWLISGLVSVEFLRGIIEPRAGRIVEADEGQYRVGLGKWQVNGAGLRNAAT